MCTLHVITGSDTVFPVDILKYRGKLSLTDTRNV